MENHENENQSSRGKVRGKDARGHRTVSPSDVRVVRLRFVAVAGLLDGAAETMYEEHPFHSGAYPGNDCRTHQTAAYRIAEIQGRAPPPALFPANGTASARRGVCVTEHKFRI